MREGKNVVTMDLPPAMSVFMGNQVNHLFVYGTLKKDGVRKDVLKDFKFIKEDKLIGYLFDLGSFPAYIPAINGMQIEGEVYEFPSESKRLHLSTLDAIEGTPDLYYRYPFRTLSGYICWTYWMPRDRIQDSWACITDGIWRGAGNNTIQKWLALLMSEDNWKMPIKMVSRYDSASRCVYCDQYQTSNKDREYLQISKDYDDLPRAYIPFSIPKATANITKGGTPSLKEQMSSLWPSKKEPITVEPGDSTVMVPMVDMVWLHGKDEKPEKATEQEVGGI